MSTQAQDPTPRRNLREECVGAALAIIDREGVEALSLRDVARRLGVSHQAPYKHFPSRDHILAEIIARAFADFAAHLDAREPGPDAQGDLAAMGRAYLAYAAAHPLQYRLMFGASLPDPAAHPAMLREARHAFSLLRAALARAAAERGNSADEAALDLDAMFVWSTMHGLASIQPSCVLETLGLPPGTLAAAAPHVLGRIGAAFGHLPPAAPPALPGEPPPPARPRARNLA